MLKNKKIIISVSATILLIAGFVFYLVLSNEKTVQTTNEIPKSENSINESSEPIKGDPSKNAEANVSKTDGEEMPVEDKDESGVKKVVPIISSWGQSPSTVEVAARVPGILETNGICILSLEKSSIKVTAEKKATDNVKEMSCGFIAINKSKLSSGEWTATVLYKSNKASGTSAPQSIRVE